VNVAVRVSCGHRCRAGFCFDDPWRFLGWLSFGPIQVCYFCFLTSMRGLIIGPIRAQVSNDKKKIRRFSQGKHEKNDGQVSSPAMLFIVLSIQQVSELNEERDILVIRGGATARASLGGHPRSLSLGIPSPPLDLASGERVRGGRDEELRG
jgi:hypothetical protein